MSRHELKWGVRYKGTPQEIDETVSRGEAVRHMARVADGGEIVVRLTSPWMSETVLEGLPEETLPAVECRHCKGTDLGFEVTVESKLVTGGTSVRPQFYQGCNDCSETLWVGDWDTFHAVLALIYDIRIPRCE